MLIKDSFKLILAPGSCRAVLFWYHAGMENSKPVLFSGIQPSGRLHIGAYIGAIKNWLALQDDYDCLFSLVDLHSITVQQEPVRLRELCYDFLALYVALGLNPEKNILFCQSHVPAHSELAWILNCYTGMGELSRMTQFKDKAKKQKMVSVGLFDYPILQAADILLYDTNIVPVGADQKQHVELTRDIAIRFNNLYGDIFTIPDVYIPAVSAGGRIMALQEPENKMSKSDPNASNVIGLLDAPDEITKKLKRAVTDSGSEIKYDESKPGVSNLLVIYSAVTDKPIEQLETEYAGQGYGKLKTDVADVVIEFLRPIQDHYHRLREDISAIDNILRHGADRARQRAASMLKKVQEIIGFISTK